MWVPRLLGAPRVDLRRRLLMLATTLLVACFTVLGPLTQMALANPGIWQDGTSSIEYDGNTYNLAPSNAPIAADEIAYQWIDTETDPDKAYLLIFDEDRELQAQAEAELITYDIENGNYSNASSPTTADIRNDLLGPETDNEEVGNTCDGSITGSLGWVLCPVSNWLAEVVDGLYEIIKTYLEVVPFTDANNGIYQLWGTVRTLANVAFIIAFLVIIYSQISNIGIGNYGIKTMLPRLIIGAILVNVSYWICALAVDISNLVGVNINAIFVNIRENLVTGGDADLNPFNGVSWTTVVNLLLAGGGATAGYLGFAVAAGGSIPSLFFLALASLISVAFSVMVAFIILAARQAIIVILVLISPLAFAAFVLPSTQSLFDKWRKSFTTLLVFFPLFGLLFGGSQLAGAAVMNSTINDPNGAKLHVLLMGMAIQIVPLVLTPLLIRFSTGILGQIANLSNNSKRGLTDRAKNWATDHADYHKGERQKKVALARANRDEFDRANGKPSRRRRIGRSLAGLAPGSLAYDIDRRKRQRERSKKESDELLGEGSNADYNRKVNDATGGRYARAQQAYIAAHDYKDAADAEHSELESKANEHMWSTYRSDSGHFDQRRHDARISANRMATAADVNKGKFEAIVEELKAGANPYAARDESGNLLLDEDTLKRLGGEAGLNSYTDTADRWKAQVEQLSFEGTRKDMATKQQTANVAARLKTTEADRIYAGGIDPNGATKVEAMAVQAASKEYMENVGAVESLYSNKGYTVQQMMEITEGKRTQLLDGTKVNDYHIHAAIQRINSDTGNNWAVQKLADFVNTQGMRYDEDTNTYTDSATGVKLEEGEIERRRDLQQMFRDSYNKGKVRVSTISQTDLSNMENGLYAVPDPNEAKNIITDNSGQQRTMIQSEASMVRDMNSDKYKEERWINEDVDVLSRYVQNLRQDGIRTKISDTQRTKLASQIQATLTNPENRARINGREGQLLQVIQKYLSDPNPTIDISTKKEYEDLYIPPTYTDDGSVIFDQKPTETTQKVPSVYKIDRQNDFGEDGVGPR